MHNYFHLCDTKLLCIRKNTRKKTKISLDMLLQFHWICIQNFSRYTKEENSQTAPISGAVIKHIMYLGNYNVYFK